MKNHQLTENQLIASFRPDQKAVNSNQQLTSQYVRNNNVGPSVINNHVVYQNNNQSGLVENQQNRVLASQQIIHTHHPSYHMSQVNGNNQPVRRKTPPINFIYNLNQSPLAYNKTQVVSTTVHQPVTQHVVRNQIVNSPQHHVHSYNQNINHQSGHIIHNTNISQQHHNQITRQIPIHNETVIKRQVINQTRHHQPVHYVNQVVVDNYRRQSNVVPFNHPANQQRVQIQKQSLNRIEQHIEVQQKQQLNVVNHQHHQQILHPNYHPNYQYYQMPPPVHGYQPAHVNYMPMPAPNHPAQVINNQYPVYQYPPEYYNQQFYNQADHQNPNPQYNYPPQYYQQNQEQQQYDQQNPNNFQPSSAQNGLWQQKFLYLHQKYHIFFQKYQSVTKETAFLADQFLTVDNQEQWLALKAKFDLLVQKMGEVKEENQILLEQINEDLQQSEKIQNNDTQIKQQNGRVWQHRYHQLLQQYESLTQHYAQLQNNSLAHNDMEQYDRLGMMNQKYALLQAQYNNVVQQLQNAPTQAQSRQQNQQFLKYTKQLQDYIQQLQLQNNTLMKGMKSSVQDSKFLQQNEINAKLIQKQSQIKNLTHMIYQLQTKMKQNPDIPVPKQGNRSSQLQNQLRQASEYCNQLQQKLSMKDYEINGLKDKVAYLQQQLSIKTQQVMVCSRQYKQQLRTLQSQFNKKKLNGDVNPQSGYQLNITQDYQNRMKQYQKLIQLKNNQIRSLQDRVYQIQSQTRKLHYQKSTHSQQWRQKLNILQSQFEHKLLQKDAKLKRLQKELDDVNNQLKTKLQDKQNNLRHIQQQTNKYKDQYQNKLIQKNLLIKSLKETLTRMQIQIKDRNVQISRIRSPNLTPMLRSPNQSFNANDNLKFQQQLRLINEQIQRRNEQNQKLKKQRQVRNKQFKDLQLQNSNLQQQLNKRRIQITNLKKQLSALQNNEYQIQNLKHTINKRTNQINQLKNSSYQIDKIKINLQSKNRQNDKLNQINRIKNKQLQDLKQRNYDLEQKIRNIQFKISNPNKTQQFNRNNMQQVYNLQDQLRKRQIQISRYKMRNQQLQHAIRKQKQQVQRAQNKYPTKIKTLSQQLFQYKSKATSLQKNYAILQAQFKELQDLNKKIRTVNIEQSNNQVTRIKDYYTKYISSQDEELKSLKQKIRNYQLQFHNYQQQNNTLSSRLRQSDISKNENLKKIQLLNDKLELKEQQLKNIRNKQNAQMNILRKRQGRVGQLQILIKQKDGQINQLQTRLQQLKQSHKIIKKEYDNYKHSTIQKLQVSTHKQMQSLNKQISQYQTKLILQNHNFDFKLKDKKANQVFQRRVIYQLKQQNDFLRKQLQGKGINISLQKLKITQMQQEALLKSKTLNNKDNTYMEQLTFYRQKNKELEQLINNHISVNKNLKERVQYLLSQSTKSQQFQRLRIRCSQFQLKQAEYIDKISKLLQQIKSIKRQMNNLNINNDLTLQYEHKIQQLNRRINGINIQNNGLSQQNSMIKVQINNIVGKYQELQRQFIKLQNEYKNIKEENDWMKINQNTNQSTINNQLSQLRRNNQRLTQVINQKQHQISTLITQNNSLQEYLRQLQQEIKKVKDKLSGNQGFSIEIEELRKIIQKLQRDNYDMNQHIVSLIQQLNFYKNQGGSFKGKDQGVYYLEHIRSNFLQVETLCDEILIENQKNAIIIEKVIQNVNLGLETCSSFNQLLIQ